MPHLAATLSLVAAMALTGANVPFGKAIVAELPIEVFLAFRFALASLALALLVGREDGPRLRAMTGSQAVSLVLMGLVGSVVFTVFILEGVKRTSGTDAGIITATLPAVVAALGFALRGEPLGPSRIAMIGLAVAGIAIMQHAGSTAGVSTLLGNLLVGLAVLCEASFVLLSQPISAVFKPVRLSLGVSLVSLGFSLPLAAPSLASFAWSSVSPGTWALATWYTLVASVLGTILWYRGAAHVETWLAGLATAALPVAALVVSATFLGEEIGFDQLVGAALVIAAIGLGAASQRRATT